MEELHNRVDLGPLPEGRSPWTSYCLLEADVAHELTLLKASYYQSLIGVLQCIIELGKGDLEI